MKIGLCHKQSSSQKEVISLLNIKPAHSSEFCCAVTQCVTQDSGLWALQRSKILDFVVDSSILHHWNPWLKTNIYHKHKSLISFLPLHFFSRHFEFSEKSFSNTS